MYHLSHIFWLFFEFPRIRMASGLRIIRADVSDLLINRWGKWGCGACGGHIAG
jgi:hypothetical protein